MAYSRIRPRRGTAYEWSTINPILESGEWGVEAPDTGIGTGFSKFKIGNGIDHWNDLEYAFDGTAAASIDGGSVQEFHVIQLRSGSTAVWLEFNPVLNKNELSYDTDKNAFKVGNGVDSWEDLPYANSGSLVDDMFDFGNEDGPDEILGYANRRSEVEGFIEDNDDYPESVIDIPVVAAEEPIKEDSEDEAGLEDLIGNEEPVEEKPTEDEPDIDLDGETP